MHDSVSARESQPADTPLYGTSPGRYQYLMRQNSADAFCAEGLRLSRKKRHKEALYWFECALKQDPSCIPALLGLGFALGKLGRYPEEIQCCEQVLAIDPLSEDALLLKGFALGMLGSFGEKIACCDQVLEIDPESARAWNMKGQALGMLGRYEEELACCERATELRPRYIGAWVNAGHALMQLNRNHDAVLAFNRAIRIYPYFTAAWVNKGIALCGLGEYHAALSCFDYPGEDISARTLYWKGLALSRTGRYKEAVLNLSRLVDEDPRYADAWVILSNCHFMLGNLDESGRCFMVAYGIDKADIRELVAKGITSWRQGNSREGLRCMSGVFGILLR